MHTGVGHTDSAVVGVLCDGMSFRSVSGHVFTDVSVSWSLPLTCLDLLLGIFTFLSLLE